MADPSPVEAGKQALAEGDRERALDLLFPLATQGDPATTGCWASNGRS